MRQVYIFVDDERRFDNSNLQEDVLLFICRTYSSAIEVLRWCRDNGCKPLLDLDHDLGEAKTGYDICKFIVEEKIPLNGYILHTMNPVGRQNMEQLLSHYGYLSF